MNFEHVTYGDDVHLLILYHFKKFLFIHFFFFIEYITLEV